MRGSEFGVKKLKTNLPFYLHRVFISCDSKSESLLLDQVVRSLQRSFGFSFCPIVTYSGDGKYALKPLRSSKYFCQHSELIEVARLFRKPSFDILMVFEKTEGQPTLSK